MQPSHVNPKILVVDDHPQNRALAQAALEDEGYQVILASTGEDCIRAFEAEHPDCILLDVRMPGLDGFAVCARIRSLPGGADTPIVFLTALRDVDTFDRALRVGANDFLTKPVRPTELVVRVQSVLKLRSMSAELREQFDLVRRQRDALMRLELQKQQLMAFVVHDLKNPVNSLDLHAQLLLRERELPPRARESAQHIREEARSLLRLVLNLLDISKSDEGSLAPRYHDVDLKALSTELLDGLDVKARAARVTLKQTIEVQVIRADFDLLRRVIENLVDNAIRHAPEDTEIQLSAVCRDGGIELRIADRGPGVPRELRDKIFERFIQLEMDQHVTRTGRGLGLAFCKLAVEAHGGTIWVEDGMPGALFCVRLPG
jgi:two-component system, sensor histidine kinase and response regulator